MKISFATLFAVASTAAAWKVTGFTDDKCTQAAGYSYGIEDSIGCLLLTKPIKSFLVEDMPDDMKFHGGSNTGCGEFITTGGNGCQYQGHEFRSFSVW